MNGTVLAALALGALAPAAIVHATGVRRLAGVIDRQGALRGPVRTYAAGVVAAEVIVSVLLVVAMWREEFRLAGICLAVIGAGFTAYVAALRRRHYTGDCGCSAVASSLTGWSLLPGGVLAVTGIVLASDRLPTASAFAAPAAAVESAAALILAFTLGFLVWTFPGSVSQ